MKIDIANKLCQINTDSKRITGASADFFFPCSLSIQPEQKGELRYLRVVLCYNSIVSECGRQPLKFCARQTQFQERYENFREHVTILQALRTTVAHSLGEIREYEQRVNTIAVSFFRSEIGADHPSCNATWEKCAERIENIVERLLYAVHDFIVSLEASEEMRLMRNELRRAIEREFSISDFHDLVHDVLQTFERNELSASQLVSRHHENWSKQLRTISDSADISSAARKIIENTVLNEPLALPITGLDLVELGAKGPQIRKLYTRAREMLTEGTRNKEELLERLRTEMLAS